MIAADFLDRLSDKERTAYVDGLLDALVYTQKTDCAYNWYYRGPGPRQLADTLQKYRALPVVAVVQQLVKRSCL